MTDPARKMRESFENDSWKPRPKLTWRDYVSTWFYLILLMLFCVILKMLLAAYF